MRFILLVSGAETRRIHSSRVSTLASTLHRPTSGAPAARIVRQRAGAAVVVVVRREVTRAPAKEDAVSAGAVTDAIFVWDVAFCFLCRQVEDGVEGEEEGVEGAEEEVEE